MTVIYDVFLIYTVIHLNTSWCITGDEEAIPMPMQSPPALIEPSFDDAITRIEASELPQATRRHWLCSLRQVGRALDRPLDSVPARWTALWPQVSRLHHQPLNITPKTLANHKANVKAALRWFTGETGGLVRGVPLSAGWAKLRDDTPDRGCRARLYGLMRFCSAKQVPPNKISDTVLESYIQYREAMGGPWVNITANRLIALTWNRCVDTVAGWPNVRLTEPTRSPRATPPREHFPNRLRADIDGYLNTLTAIRRGAGGRRRHAAKSSTIAFRRGLLIAMARKAVKIGIPINDLDSLAALLRPDRVERVLEAYWGTDENAPKPYAVDLACMIVSIARETGCVSEEEIQKLDDFRAALDQHRSQGLTDRNLAVIRQILTSSIWREVVNLPYRLMQEARASRDQAPLKAALKAQRAVAIGLLTVAPVRCGNLAAIKLNENLVRPSGPDLPFWLIFPQHDVKNRIRLDFPLDERLTSLIEVYLTDYRPTLLRGTRQLWLFPGLNGTHKRKQVLSEQITAAVERATGLRIRAHQFRHAAAALILQREPGNYEFARRVLGHKSIRTTINSYVGLETTDANRRFGEIVRQHLFREERL